jgi:hypothetical protein
VVIAWPVGVPFSLPVPFALPLFIRYSWGGHGAFLGDAAVDLMTGDDAGSTGDL